MNWHEMTLIEQLIYHVLNEGGCHEHNLFIVKSNLGYEVKAKNKKQLLAKLEAMK